MKNSGRYLLGLLGLEILAFSRLANITLYRTYLTSKNHVMSKSTLDEKAVKKVQKRAVNNTVPAVVPCRKFFRKFSLR